MDRLTRKELKTDRFQVETRHVFDYLSEHRREAIRYGILAAVAVVVVLGIYLYGRHQKNVRYQVLEAALRIYQAPVGSTEPGGYPTRAERDKAVTKAFTDLLGRYSSGEEATVARYYLGSMAAYEGRYAEAEKHLRTAAEGGPSAYASLAKLALAEVYAGQGKVSEAEKLLRSLMNKPTLFVSKEQAAIELARILAPAKPAEARKLLEPLRTNKRSAVSRAALTQLAALPSQ